MVKIKSVSSCKQVTFFADGYLLRGMLHLPSATCPPVVIGSHGLISSSDSPKQIALADRCNIHGIAYFRFDHRGCGRSQGFFPEVTSLEARASDLRHAIRLMRARRDVGDAIGLFGSSMGGAACLAIAASAAIDALVSFAAPIRGRTIHHSVDHVNDSVPPSPRAADTHIDFDISKQLDGICNILIFHGEADATVPFTDALEIYKAVSGPKQLIRQEKGDHLMSRKRHQDRFMRKTMHWFATHLPGARSAHLGR
jgi:alpha-beta hydrolase superfamily lysophospholipase